AQAAFRFGLQNVKIKVEVNEAGEFPELAQRMSIRAVPALVIDEQVVVLGAMDETKMAEAVLRVVEGKELDQSFGSRQFTPFNPAPSRAAAPSQQRVTSSGLI